MALTYDPDAHGYRDAESHDMAWWRAQWAEELNLLRPDVLVKPEDE